MIIKKEKERNIELLFFSYWLTLVIWQNIGAPGKGSSFDTILKITLFFCFITYYFIYGTKKMKVSSFLNTIVIFLILLVGFVNNESISFWGLADYFYPVIFIACIFLIGKDFIINKKQLIRLLNGIIIVVFYSSIYALIFCTSQFVNALSLTNAYGNELSSFFVSSHEYALYLMVASIGALICLELKKKEKLSHKWYYIAVLPIFLANIVLTFSRTALAGFTVAVILYCIFNRKSLIGKFVFLCVLTFLLIIIFSDTFRFFVFKIVLKENNLAGRDELTSFAIDKFKEGTIFQKLFGYGNSMIREDTKISLGHSSIHNAYLQILISYGGIILIAFILFLIYDLYMCIRLCKKNRFLGGMLLAMVFSGIIIMLFNTIYIFGSPIDTFFLTLVVVVIPKYVGNAIMQGSF